MACGGGGGGGVSRDMDGCACGGVSCAGGIESLVVGGILDNGRICVGVIGATALATACAMVSGGTIGGTSGGTSGAGGGGALASRIEDRLGSPNIRGFLFCSCVNMVALSASILVGDRHSRHSLGHSESLSLGRYDV
jgi:hypothetical protein